LERPGGEFEVDRVDRRGLHANQHLAFRRVRVGGVFVPQPFWSAVLIEPNGFHGKEPLPVM
jgi:hypothetical protein